MIAGLLALAQFAAAQSADVSYKGPLFGLASESRFVMGELGALSLSFGDHHLWIYDSRHLDVSEDPETAVIDLAEAADFSVDPASAATILGGPGARFYPTSVLKIGESIHLFYAYAESSVYKGEGLAISTGASFSARTALWDAEQPNFGLASVAGKDGLIYLYGVTHGKPGEMKLARVEPESIAALEKYEYFAGKDWSKDQTQAADLFKASPAEASVSYNDYLGAYLMLYGRYPHNDIVIRTAPEPWGPWSEPRSIHRCVLSDPKGSCAAAREQAAYAKDGGRTIYFTVNDPFRFFAGGRPELYEVGFDKGRPAEKADSIQMSVNNNYPATLFRIINTLAGSNPSYYLEFWREQFGFGDKEKELLKDYARIRKAYDLTIDSRSGDAPSPLPRASFTLSEKWPPLFAESESLDEAWAKAESILDAKDIDALKRVFAHFDSRFRPYWEKHSKNLYQAAVDFDRDRWRLKISDYLSRVARFYGLEPGLERRYTLSLIWHPPTSRAKIMRSERIGRVMLVELPEDVGLKDQLDTVVHEFIHDLYAAREPKAESELAEGLLKRDLNAGLFAVIGMNEGFATALGQGLFIEEYMPKRFSLKSSWYATDVDAYAKAALPIVKKAFEQKKSLGDFDAELITALSPAAKEARLPAFFGHHQLLADAKTAGLTQAVWEALDVHAAFGHTLGDKEDDERFPLKLKAHWAEPVVVMLEPDSLDEKVAGWMDWDLDASMIRLLKRRAAKFPVVAIARSKRGRPYLLLLGNTEALRIRILALKDMHL